MPSQETLLTVILAAIAVNVVVAVGILIAARRSRRAEVGPSPRSRPSTTAAVAGRTLTPVFGNPPRGEHVVDPQTGLDVAATWDRWLAEENLRLQRYRRPVTVVLIELHDLDRLEERLGPAVADRLVPPIATTLRRQARAADRVARLGRGRFGVILLETDEVRAINYVERVRAAADLWLEAGAVSTRLSVGWAAASGDGSGTLSDAVATAEARMHGDRRRPDAIDDVVAAAHRIVESPAG